MKISVRMRKGLFGLAIAVFGAFTVPASANSPWEAGKKYALVVGIDDYQNESVTDLQCATSDAKLLKSTLVQAGQFPEENIFLLTSDSTGESSKPSLTNIVFRLEWLREIVGPGDTLVFYFAGHGVSMDSETFLLTEEADQRSKNTLMVSSLPGRVLNQLLKDAGAQNTLVLLDACRNDPTAGRGDANNMLSETLARGLVFKPLPAPAAGLERNTATVFACSEGERSWEWGDKNQGFFTYYLAEALKQGAYDTQGQATLQGLVAYLREKVNAAALREANHAQTPMLKYEGPGAERWVLAKSESKAGLSEAEKKAALERAELVAKVEASELEKRRLADENASLKAKNELIEAQNKVLALEKSTQGGGDKALLSLETAQAELQVAQASVEATSERLAFTESSYLQAEVKAETATLAKSVFGNPNAHPEQEQKLLELQKRLQALENERRLAVDRALTAERRVRQLKRNPLGKDARPSRTTLPSDLWWFEQTKEEEADSL